MAADGVYNMGMPPVLGINVDAHTRCAHYHSAVDVIAIKIRCCGEYYACIACHAALAAHAPEVWPATEWDRRAILCGVCRSELTIHAYFESGAACPVCRAAFNPRCALHHHLYFDLPRP